MKEIDKKERIIFIEALFLEGRSIKKKVSTDNIIDIRIRITFPKLVSNKISIFFAKEKIT